MRKVEAMESDATTAPARTTPCPSAGATRFPGGLPRRAPGASDRLKLSAERLHLSSIRAFPLRALGAQEGVIVEVLQLDPRNEDPRWAGRLASSSCFSASKKEHRRVARPSLLQTLRCARSSIPRLFSSLPQTALTISGTASPAGRPCRRSNNAPVSPPSFSFSRPNAS